MERTVKLLPFQLKFLQSQTKFVWLCAGLGTGKTYSLANYAIYRMLTNPKTTGLLAAQTYSQLRDATLAELMVQLDRLGLKYSYSTLTNFLTLDCNGARIKTFSLENYEMLRGIEIGWFGVDEACLVKPDAKKVLVGRLRCKHSHVLQGRYVSTPRGFDHMYDQFVGEHKTVNHELIHATSFDNPHLPEGYIASMAAEYSPKEYQQEVLADFVALSEGRVYHAFDRTEHVRDVFPSDFGAIYVGMDFNVNPMTAVLANVTQGCIEVFDEVYLANSNTYAMAEEIRKRYPHRRIIIAPDASGSARKSSSTQSDHEILKSYGFEVQTSTRNPAIEDRYNTINGRMRESRISIAPKCLKLIRDLERVEHDKNPSYLTHISDALGYLAWRIFPLKRTRKPSGIIQL